MYPSDEEIQQMFKEDFENAKQYSKKLTLVSLTAPSTSSSDSKTKDDQSSQQQQDQNPDVITTTQHQ